MTNVKIRQNYNKKRGITWHGINTENMTTPTFLKKTSTIVLMMYLLKTRNTRQKKKPRKKRKSRQLQLIAKTCCNFAELLAKMDTE